MQLHFNRARAERLLAHAEAALAHRPLYDQGAAAPALWVVGDDGIYICSNGDPILASDGETAMLVCYADECNPQTMPFEQWWAIKNQSWGGDDGAICFDASDVRAALSTYPPGDALIIDSSPDGISLIAYRTVLTPKLANRCTCKRSE